MTPLRTMVRRYILPVIFAAYCALLVKVMVFKDIPTIRIGHFMLNMGGTDGGGEPNFIPFKTILPYLFGYKGLIIAGINLIGNVGLLIPIGIFAPLVFRNMSWLKSVLLGVIAGLSLEAMQTLLQVGRFDVDDVILNALGVVIGYGLYRIVVRKA